MKKMYKVSVIGSGSWGTSLSNLLSINGVDTTLYVRNRELFLNILEKGENSVYLPSIKLNEKLRIVNSIDEACSFADVILLSVPVVYLRNVLKELSCCVNKNHIIMSSMKGMENGTFFTPSQIVGDVLHIGEESFAVISGPNFAKEVAQKLPTATVVASKNIDLTKNLQNIFSCEYFRVYRSEDVSGVEIAAAMKNVMAIATGLSDGMGLGNNARASLITRGLAEMMRIGIKLNAKKETFMGLAGMGDLVLTCTGDLSRNRQVGMKLAKSENITDILSKMKMIAEGVNSARSFFNLSKKLDIEMPITDQVYKILYENKNPKVAVYDLMTRPLKSEFIF